MMTINHLCNFRSKVLTLLSDFRAPWRLRGRMTRRINQKLAVKRRKEEQEEELKAAKKAKKAEKKVEAETKVNSGQTVIVDRLVAGGEEALRAHTLLASGEEVTVALLLHNWHQITIYI